MMNNKYYVLAVVCLSSAMVPFSGNSITLALPDIATDLSMNALALSWIVLSMMLPAAALQIAMSKLADRVGRRKLMSVGVALFVATSVACALAPSGAWLLAMRAVQGVACAILFSIAAAIITSVFPPEERGKALGINTATIYGALAAGPFFGGMLTHYFGWRSIFWVTAAIGAFAFVGLLTISREWKESQHGRFDYTGTAIYAIALTGIIFGFSQLPSAVGIVMIAVGMAALFGFVRFEGRQTSPVFDIRMFMANRVFRMSLFAALINYASTFAISFLLSLYLQYIKGFNAQVAGWILLSQPVVQMLLSPVAGILSDRADAGKIATFGMALIVVCLVGLLFITTDTSLPLLIVILAFLGAGFALFSSPNMNVIMGSVENRHLGMASATAGTMRLIGQAVSMGITMMFISIFIGKLRIEPSLYPQLLQCMKVTFGILAGLCCLGVYTSMVRR